MKREEDKGIITNRRETFSERTHDQLFNDGQELDRQEQSKSKYKQ